MNGSIQTTSAVILAGGASSRMGRCKAELDFHGETLLSHTINKLRSLGLRDIVISGARTDAESVRTVPDIYPGRGPLGGIHAALLAIQNPAAMVLAVDTPLLPVSLLRELIEAHRGGITLLTHGELIEPLIGIYDRAVARDCEALLRGDSSSLRRLIGSLGYTAYPFNGDAAVLSNCNTPEEYLRALRYSEQNQ